MQKGAISAFSSKRIYIYQRPMQEGAISAFSGSTLSTIHYKIEVNYRRFFARHMVMQIVLNFDNLYYEEHIITCKAKYNLF